MQTARETTVPLARRPMLHALAKCWWLLLLRGIAAIVFGVLAFVWPGLTLVTLVLLYGAFALVDGVLSLIAAFTGSVKPAPTWWLVVVGLLGIAAGIVTFAWPGITAILLIPVHRRLGVGTRHFRDHRRDPAAQRDRQRMDVDPRRSLVRGFRRPRITRAWRRGARADLGHCQLLNLVRHPVRRACVAAQET